MEQHITYRIERAKETFHDAVYLFEKGSWNSSMNRLYYAAFYAAIALLLTCGLEVKSHNGVKRKIGELVVKGKLERKHSKTFGLLADLRHKGDYDDLFDFNEDMIKVLIQPTEEFILDIEKILT